MCAFDRVRKGVWGGRGGGADWSRCEGKEVRSVVFKGRVLVERLLVECAEEAACV